MSFLKPDMFNMSETPELLLTEGISRVKPSTRMILSNSFEYCQPIQHSLLGFDSFFMQSGASEI
jgi:hypothetical protein